jgi:hypothetical protein
VVNGVVQLFANLHGAIVLTGLWPWQRGFVPQAVAVRQPNGAADA